MDTAGALFTAAYVTDKYCPKDTCDFTDLIDLIDFHGFSRIGGRSEAFALRCISTFCTRMVGEVAVTGMPPDSAPHVPVNISGALPAYMMFENMERGVPMRSTPRTSLSGRPSAYTSYTSRHCSFLY